MKCKICGKEFEKLGNHIIQKHRMPRKEYYDKYLKKPGEGICPICGKETSFKKAFKGYTKYCSRKCAANSKEVRSKYEQTCLKRYGVTNTYAVEEKIVKRKQTLENKSEEEKLLIRKRMSEGTRKQLLSRTEEEKKKVYNKVRATIFERYGVTCIFQREDIQKNSHSKEARDKFSQTMKNKSLKEKEEYSKKLSEAQINRHKNMSKEQKKLMYKKIVKTRQNRTPEEKRATALKAAKTRKKNGNRSKTELYFEKLLKENDITYEVEYNLDKRYPYYCDFYLTDYDIFVEINDHWTHGDHWFDKSNKEDLEKVKEWEKRNTDYYRNAINTWTIRDIEKKEIAKKSRLKYFGLFNYEEIDRFFEEKLYL